MTQSLYIEVREKTSSEGLACLDVRLVRLNVAERARAEVLPSFQFTPPIPAQRWCVGA